jgi:hypothetical protein
VLSRLLTVFMAVVIACGCSRATTSSSPATSLPCDDAQFIADQQGFGSGTMTADQLVDICGKVTRVRAARRTRSGTHGYFFVRMPSGYQIEIVANLDAMAEASTDRPPAAWPWVAAGDYVYVEGRYYYDNASRQGVDWTEDDAGRSWPHTGYVAVCNAAGTNCVKYW